MTGTIAIASVHIAGIAGQTCPNRENGQGGARAIYSKSNPSCLCVWSKYTETFTIHTSITYLSIYTRMYTWNMYLSMAKYRFPFVVWIMSSWLNITDLTILPLDSSHYVDLKTPIRHHDPLTYCGIEDVATVHVPDQLGKNQYNWEVCRFGNR